MQLSKIKNTIVLKGLSSNVVEEAIVVLKPNVKIKQGEYNTKAKHSAKDKNKKMIVIKEAESTINTYIKRLQKETRLDEMNSLKKKYKFLQLFNITLIISIIIATLFIT